MLSADNLRIQNLRNAQAESAINECRIAAGLDIMGPDDDPLTSLRDLITWEISIALDPSVSDAPGQSRLMSFLESWVNIAIGFGVSVAANILVLPLFGFEPSTSDALGIGLIFTAISFARSYLVRRLFNRIQRR